MAASIDSQRDSVDHPFSLPGTHVYDVSRAAKLRHLDYAGDFYMQEFFNRWSFTAALLSLMVAVEPRRGEAADNVLSPEEEKAGWILLFDGKSLDGWKTSSGQPSKVPVEDGEHQPPRLRRLHDDPPEDLVRLCAGARLQDQQGLQQRRLHPDLSADAAPGQGRRLQRHRGRHRRHDDGRIPRHRSVLRPGQAVGERHEAGRASGTTW